MAREDEMIEAYSAEVSSPAGVSCAAASGYVTGTEAEVCADIAARQQRGIAKYGVTVQDNPLPLKEWLQHAYEETLDKAIYLKRAIAECSHTDKVSNRGSENEH